MEISVKLIKSPTEEDWLFCKRCTLNTVGLKPKGAPDFKWKKKLLHCEHSPIRTLWFGFELEIPYYCSNHLVRHKIGCEHFVQSQRDDRQRTESIPRAEKPQGEFVTHVLYINAQELMFFMRKRLCSQADLTTQKIARLMRDEVLKVAPEFDGELVPACEYQHECREMFPCAKAKKINKEI